MPFAEPLKLLVKQRAHFRCCICRSVGVEIHHIVPQEESGPDTDDNAAPLCPSCHELYGANPTKRKFIREARDFWYDLCRQNQSNEGLTAEALHTALEDVASRKDILDLKAKMSKLLAIHQSATPSIDGSQLVPVPIEQFIQSLYQRDYGDGQDFYDWFFDSRLWYDQGSDSYELLDFRAWFLKLYGEETARRVCLSAMDETGFDPKGFTEEDFADVVGAIRVTVILVRLHEKHSPGAQAIQCVRRPDGEFLWRKKPKVKRVRQGKKCAPGKSVRRDSR